MLGGLRVQSLPSQVDRGGECLGFQRAMPRVAPCSRMDSGRSCVVWGWMPWRTEGCSRFGCGQVDYLEGRNPRSARERAVLVRHGSAAGATPRFLRS
jgi:hypothetical protein